ncbi:MAG TPA: bifunctional methylenetetrahydrofolate dehydrogenase/methenyltetrahydrofolate cyclohydrolase FolD [Pseudomonadota bacterium]|nr:bifunctional methylenetetrahydrofolate dehydrogenase/methenyltetrahydrofolate cyclohydrolase FolD [Pseudomonadota bacterium]
MSDETQTARILDGKALAAVVRAEVKEQVSALLASGVTPGLAVVLVGEDPASQIYVRNKTRAGQEVGIAVFDHKLPKDTTEAALITLLQQLSADPKVHGVLVQLPLPAPLSATRILEALDPAKDVDGLLTQNVGLLWLGRPHLVPCTPLGVMRLLKEAGTSLAGAKAVVVGRSNLVGRPIAGLLLAADATVTICHSRTRDLPQQVAAADIVIAALGRPESIRGEWIRPGATVIDVGINRLADGKIVGDVEFDVARQRAGAITPVPGGVGPLTIAMLLSNTAQAARAQSGR